MLAGLTAPTGGRGIAISSRRILGWLRIDMSGAAEHRAGRRVQRERQFAAETKMRNGSLRSRQIIAFVATTTPTRAKNFFAGTLGLRLVSEDAFALVFDAGGTMLRVAIVQELRPAAYTVLGRIVPDISDTIEDLERQGVAFQRFDGLQQDDHGVWVAPSGARVAWFRDPDGNTLSLTEFGERSNKRLTPTRPRSSKARRSGVRLRRKR